MKIIGKIIKIKPYKYETKKPNKLVLPALNPTAAIKPGIVLKN